MKSSIRYGWLLVAGFLVAAPLFAQVSRETRAPQRFALIEPNTFLAGFGSEKHGRVNDVFTDPHNQMKFHIALKMRVIPFGRFADGFYGGYSQTSFWDPYVKYAPALDNTYTPEAYFYWDNGPDKRETGWRWWKPSLKVSFTHQSNGLGGTDSRTWNRFILEGDFGDPTRTPLVLGVSCWYPFNDYDNPDIRDQLGWGAIRLSWQPLVRRYPDGMRVFGLLAETYYGVRDRVLKRLRLEVYIHPLLLDRRLDWMPTLLVQYFTGRGESLMLYNHDTHALRVGVALYP